MATSLTTEQQTRLSNVNNNKEKAIAENNKAYDNLISQAGEVRTQADEYAAKYETTQNEILDKQLANQTEQINQQKEEAQKTATTESNKALNDYQSYINPYGYQSEVMGNSGLSRSGVSETAQLGAYTTYQNRVSQANATLQTAITSYNNSLNEAILNNDVSKAQNALTKLQTQLDNLQTYYSNTSSLTQNKLSTSQSLASDYDSQYNTVYSQILSEQEQAEAIREYEKSYAYQVARDKVEDEQWEKQYNLSKKAASSSSGGTTSKEKATLPVSQETSYKQVASYKLSDSKAQSYWNSLVGNKTSLTESELATNLQKLSNKYSLSDSDYNTILRAYGISSQTNSSSSSKTTTKSSSTSKTTLKGKY